MKKKQLKWFKNNTIHTYGYIDKNNTLIHKMSIFKEKGIYELAINGQWHIFKKLSTAKQVGELIFNG